MRLRMDLQHLVATIKARPDYHKVGMIACHNGVVRSTSRDGRKVEGLKIEVDRELLERILAEQRRRSGIIEVLAHVFEGLRRVGDDVMLVAIAGDIRENVFPVLVETVEQLKKLVTHKEELFVN
jgi:molybdopterin synthase catalytic subunit